MEDKKMTEVIKEIKAAIGSKDLGRARALLREALKQPTPEIYYLAAQVPIDREQQIRLLERAVDLDPFYQPATLKLSELKALHSDINSINVIPPPSADLSTNVPSDSTQILYKPKQSTLPQWVNIATIGIIAIFLLVTIIVVSNNSSSFSSSYKQPDPPTRTPQPTPTPILPLGNIFVDAQKTDSTSSSPLTLESGKEYCIVVEGVYKFGDEAWQYRDAFFEYTSEGVWVKQVNLSVNASRAYLQSLPLAVDPLHSYLFSYKGKGTSATFKLYDQFDWTIDDIGGVNVKIYDQPCNVLIQ